MLKETDENTEHEKYVMAELLRLWHRIAQTVNNQLLHE